MEPAFMVTDPPRVDGDAARSSLARLVLVEAAVLGVLADAVLHTESLGAGFTFWILGLATTVTLIAFRRGQPLRPLQYLWLGLSIVCSIALAWRDADMLQFANFVAAHAALVLFTMSAIAGDAHVFGARLRDMFGAGRRIVFDALFGAPALIGREADVAETAGRFMRERVPVLRAALIALPLLYIFGALLSSADPAFAALFRLPRFEVDVFLSHAILIGAAAWISAGWMRGVFLRDGLSPGAVVAPRAHVGTTDITIVLGSLNVLFGVFVAIQARWLFGGADVIRDTTGLTVAEYARKGFFELVTVAALALPLLLGSRALAEGDAAAVRRHRQMALPMLGLMGGIMLSAVQRMSLYVGNYGLTTDRVYALAFMAWLATVFACMAVTVLRGWLRPFAAYTVLSAYGALFALNLANPDAAVARYELGRSDRVTAIDWKYLGTLSGDAMPAVVPALLSLGPDAAGCEAARWIIRRKGSRPHQGLIEYNAGESAGHSVVLEGFTPHSLRRLCSASSSATSPSVSLSR